MNEDQLEQEMLAWLVELVCAYRFSLVIAHNGPAPVRSNCRSLVLTPRLRHWSILRYLPVGEVSANRNGGGVG